jgi:FkbM family methyltransferase
MESSDDGEFQTVVINGKPYAWPRACSREELLWITAELDMPDHPHQYLWGQTKVARGDVVIDVGACEGAFSAMVAEQGARPIIVEPSRRMAKVSKRLFELRGLPEPTFVSSAVAEKNRSMFFEDDQTAVQDGRLVEHHTGKPGYQVDVRPLDTVVEDLKLSRVDFIKCDAEGADLEVLRSAKRTLEKFHPKLAFCTYHDPDHFDQMRSFLKPMGYKMKGKGLRRIGDRLAVVLLHAW